MASTQSLFEIDDCTLEQLIIAGSDYLQSYPLVYGHGTDNAMDESAWIAIEACDLSPATPLDDYGIAVTTEQLQRARKWYRARAEKHTPVAYLTGRSWFAGLEFKVDVRALVPRSPIAELILSDFQPWLAAEPNHILDLCCGGGCIGIAACVYTENSKVTGCDISDEALSLAKENARLHNIQDRYEVYQGDLFDSLPAGRRYELILSNPPYVDAEDMQALAGEFHHEPVLGLQAGEDGLDIVARILNEAGEYLTGNGILIVEVGNSEEAVDQRFPSLPLVWLEFENGGSGVFLVEAEGLQQWKNQRAD
jgi:ribosomal protein L3 glutamine methyltransferase